MNITAITPNLSAVPDLEKTADPSVAPTPEQVEKVSRQFESILVRQFLNESMKSLLQDGPSGQVYGYLLTDSLASSISEGGGLGLSHVLQTQLTKEK